jgi:hypothetical protein
MGRDLLNNSLSFNFQTSISLNNHQQLKTLRSLFLFIVDLTSHSAVIASIWMRTIHCLYSRIQECSYSSHFYTIQHSIQWYISHILNLTPSIIQYNSSFSSAYPFWLGLNLQLTVVTYQLSSIWSFNFLILSGSIFKWCWDY